MPPIDTLDEEILNGPKEWFNEEAVKWLRLFMICRQNRHPNDDALWALFCRHAASSEFRDSEFSDWMKASKCIANNENYLHNAYYWVYLSRNAVL